MRLRNPNDPRAMPLDVVGLGLLRWAWARCSTCSAKASATTGSDDPVIRTFGVSAPDRLVAFIVWELFGTSSPIVDLRAFALSAVAAGTTLGFAIGSVLFGATVIFPQYVQRLLGFTATLSGESDLRPGVRSSRR